MSRLIRDVTLLVRCGTRHLQAVLPRRGLGARQPHTARDGKNAQTRIVARPGLLGDRCERRCPPQQVVSDHDVRLRTGQRPAAGKRPRASPVLGSLRLVHAAASFRVGRIVILSSRAVFGRPARTRVGDNHPTFANTHYGAHKVALESLAGVYPGTTCIRPTGVYGITHPPNRSKWFDMARHVVVGRPVTTARTSTEVHGDDLGPPSGCCSRRAKPMLRDAPSTVPTSS